VWCDEVVVLVVLVVMEVGTVGEHKVERVHQDLRCATFARGTRGVCVVERVSR
jgi:hypothetical protein